MSEAKWYILHTYSGYENKVMNDITTLVENRNLHSLIEDVMVPVEIVTVTNEGKTKTTEEKLFPCYVYVKMQMTDESWYICRNTRGVTGFVGPGSKPIPLTDREVEMLGVAKSVPEVAVAVGELVKIVGGALAGFEGKVTEMDVESNSVVISVSMFGRETPVTLKISDVEKLEF
ncbi:transcription termination/antitermination protein NusG [Clostridia bacterium]|nr:transcription termination/antitermination protein NusG [Clostridia bacterium]